MPFVKLYIATSLDGYIARPDGSLDWLFALPNPNQGDHDYNQFLSTIGAIIMGSTTYLDVIGFEIEWPYSNMNTYILSRNKELKISSPMTERIDEDIKDFSERIKANTKKDIWLVGGGKVITSFLNHNLVDEMILCIIPTILGERIPLFPDQPIESIWNFAEARSFETGVVNLVYRKKV